MNKTSHYYYQFLEDRFKILSPKFTTVSPILLEGVVNVRFERQLRSLKQPYNENVGKMKNAEVNKNAKQFKTEYLRQFDKLGDCCRHFLFCQAVQDRNEEADVHVSLVIDLTNLVDELLRWTSL